MDTELQIGQNTGFIAQEPRPTDFIAGGETGISWDAQNLISADWRPFLPSDERQKINGFESDACVTFSGTNNLETEADFAIANNLWPADAVKFLQTQGYIDATGKVNFSDRFTAKMSGTTTNGNSLVGVADSIRKQGLIPEADWQFPENATWETYYADIPQDRKDKGLAFLTHFQVQYEFVAWPGKLMAMGDFFTELGKSPLQIATAVCPGWNDAPVIPACGTGTQHATTMTFVEPGIAFHIYDHYLPFQKEFSSEYVITYAFRYHISPIVQPSPTPYHHTYLIDLAYGAPSGEEVKALQLGLQALGFMKSGIFGPYGPQTRVAVASFQSAHGIVDPNPGQHFGPKTRAALTEALNSQ